jgi:signal transduction histidine kinase/CheY-like chemotaxis protein
MYRDVMIGSRHFNLFAHCDKVDAAMATDPIDATGEGASAEAWRRGLASAIMLIAAIGLIVLVFMVARSNSERDQALVRERHSYDIMVSVRALDASMARAEAALGRFVIDGNPANGTIYYDEWKRAGRQLRQLATLTADNPEQATLVKELGHLYVQRGSELTVPASYANFRKGWTALGLFNEAGKASSVPRIAKTLEKIADNERATLGRRSNRAESTVVRSNSFAAMLSLLGVIVTLGALGLGWMTAEAIKQRRAARNAAIVEAERAETLEQAVAERTRELIDANERLRQEAATRERAEAQLRQVQKMEAVGQLTGGIAHDFNNMLAVVIGGIDLARRRLGKSKDEVARQLENAMEGATRAAALTRRLLAFARAEPLLPAGVEPGKLIAGMSELLDRTLGERIVVRTEGMLAPWKVWVDPHQLENAILNLAVNARDAMEDEGLLVIGVDNVVLGDGEIGDATAGEYVRVCVTDNGCGMSPEIAERVFEPFFTTKPPGKGTGLGLSQIFGFVRQSRGEITIESAPGEGTTVTLYLPRFVSRETAAPAFAAGKIAEPQQGTAEGGVMLVVEDDVRVRLSTVSALEELGYVPLACGSADEAVDLLAARDDIRLIITDVVMPGMTGPELVRRVAPLYPELAVLFVTGYVGDAGDAEQFADYAMLRKPFTVSALAAAVAEALAHNKRHVERAA